MGRQGADLETLAICRTLALARAAFAVAIEEKPAWRCGARGKRSGGANAGPA
jgi:hypothetical protein